MKKPTTALTDFAPQMPKHSNCPNVDFPIIGTPRDLVVTLEQKKDRKI